jgi:hypothetical protein
MALKPGLFVCGVLLSGIALACSAAPARAPITDGTTAPGATHAAPVSEVEVEAAPARLEERPLTELAPEAVAYLESRAMPVGMAVVVPDHNAIYTWNGHERFTMASVIKVPIMLAAMDRALASADGLSEVELALMRDMITVSDNESATTFWNDLDEGAGVEAYMHSIGLHEFEASADENWGSSLASPHDIALLFAMLAFGELLDEDMRATAIGLLRDVDREQAWGVMAPALEGGGGGEDQAIIGVKDGWYPDDTGWRANSAGMYLPPSEHGAFTMAFLSNDQPSMEYGIETIETVARMVHERLVAESASTQRAGGSAIE